MESELRQLRQDLLAEREKNQKLQNLLSVYQKHIPKNDLKYLKATEKETHVNFIQRAFKKKKQTENFVKLGKKKTSLKISVIVGEFKKSKISKGLREKNNILKEIISTEEEYVTCLNYINQVKF